MLRSNAKSAEENGGPLHQVLEEKALLQSHLTSLRTGHDLSSLSRIAHRIKKYHLPAIHFPDNLDDTKKALRSVQARIRQIRQQSKSVREQSLIDQVRDSAYRGKKFDAEILEMMKKKEALAERWRRIGFLQGKCRTSQFTKVSAVDWSATSPAADDILDGNYHIRPDEYCTFDEDDVETPHQHTLLQEFLSSCCSIRALRTRHSDTANRRRTYRLRDVWHSYDLCRHKELIATEFLRAYMPLEAEGPTALKEKPFSRSPVLSAINKPIPRKERPEIVIGLERPIPKDPRDKTAFVRFSCRNDPNDPPDSPTYELQVPYFESGTPAELLELLEKVAGVHTGQDLTSGPERYSLIRRVLKGAAKTEFENSVCDHGGNETVANYNAVIEMLKAKLFPTNALRDQKRALQKHLKKPHDMSMRAYASRMSELNELLLQFPPREPGLVATNFDEDEIIQCIEDGLPPYYKKFMREHGFQPVNGSLSDFIKFVTERIEPNDTEKHTKGKRKSATQSNDNGQNGKKKSQKKSNNTSKSQQGKDKTYIGEKYLALF
eukprot:scaffold7403_cov122-Cylindrotheca_fusiformis.AAC.1